MGKINKYFFLLAKIIANSYNTNISSLKKSSRLKNDENSSLNNKKVEIKNIKFQNNVDLKKFLSGLTPSKEALETLKMKTSYYNECEHLKKNIILEEKKIKQKIKTDLKSFRNQFNS